MVKYIVFAWLFLVIAVLGIISSNDGLFAAGIASANIYSVGSMLRTEILVNKKENN